ncbi:hypothetical protein N7548_01405 [Acholeplasma manati]|uniref:MFS transporter n=1 Tax=Paracholeplasma manati TaxID=591373 RepID=A0ABT2Y426_9MOLU|nr:hypothetical protein [Paracholeplasma manati]MCV2231484.1 hypothetical protein [Paracholeplasma manati]
MESLSTCKIYRKRYLWSISIFIIFIGILFDTYLSEVYIITISDISMYYTALVTVGAISATLITIVSSSLDNRVLSFKLKEILNFTNKYLSIKTFVPTNIVLIFVGTIAYMLNLTNALFMVFFVILMFTGIFSFYIWICATDSSFPIELAKEEIERLSSLKDQENKTFDLLMKAFKHTYNTDSSEYAIIEDLLRDNYSKTDQTYNISKIREIFDYIISKDGPTKAFSIIIYITSKNNKEYKNYEIKKIILDFAFEMQNATYVKIDNYDIFNFYRNITRQYELFGTYSTLLLYKSFSMIFDNNKLGYKPRLLFAEQYIGLLCRFISAYKADLFSIQQRVYLELYIDYVLLNSNNDNMKMTIHNYFVNGLTNISTYLKERLFETLLLMYFSEYMLSRMIQFNSQNNQKVLDLKGISIIRHIKKLDYVFIQTSIKLYQEINSYLYLGKVLKNGPFLENLNYEFIEFLLINSFVFDSFIKWPQVMERIIHETTLENTKQLFRLFDKGKEILVEEVRDHIKFISIEALKQRNDLVQLSKTYFNIINKKIINAEIIVGKLDENRISIRKQDLLSSIDLFLDKLPHQTLGEKLDCVDKYVEFIVEKDDLDNDILFVDVAMANIKSVLFELLKEKGSKIQFSYNDESYEKLLDLLIEKGYNTHNSTIDSEIELWTNEKIYKLWKEETANLNYIDVLNEYGIIFYNSSMFKISLELLDFTLRDLTDTEISSFLEGYEIYPNKYSFVDALYVRSEAEKYVSNKYQKIVIRVTICVGFGPDDLLIVEQL